MRSQHIVILGNSGFARECLLMLRAVMERDPYVSFKGFLSFEGFQADLKDFAPYFLGTDDEYRFAEGESAIIGIGAPDLRARALAKLRARGVPLHTLIHPRAFVDPGLAMGQGNIIGCNCYISCHCVIGSGNVLNGLVHMGHDSVLGNCNFIGPGVQILGCVSMGSGNSIGASSVIMPHAKIGHANLIAPLSAVYKGCRDNCYMAGNPAVKIGTR